jgi:hypothetical protein
MPWQINFDSNVWDEESLTIGECELIEEQTGEGWFNINPLRTAKHCRVIISVLLQTRNGLEKAEAEGKVRSTPANQLLDGQGIKFVDSSLPDEYENGNPPQAESATL